MKNLLLLEDKTRSETENISIVAKELGINITVKELKDFPVDLNNLGYCEKEIKKFDGLWVRTYTDFSIVRILCYLFESHNKPVFGANSQDSSFIQDKMADLWQLKINNVAIPHTQSVSSELKNVIYKPYWGFGGFGIETTNPNKPYYYQQELINKQSDIRVYTSNYKVIPLVIQRTNLCDFRTNKHQGGSSEVFSFEQFSALEGDNILSQISKTALNAAKALKRPFSAIDLIRNGNEYQVLEVNRTPRIRIDEVHNKFIIEAMLKDIMDMLK